MKIYISYSLGHTDLYIATVLAREAQAKGITVENSQEAAPGIEWATMISHRIVSSDVIVAIVSRDSVNSANVQRELEFAKAYGRPVLALVEKGLYPAIDVVGIQCVEFDRRDLSPALSQINWILERQKNDKTLKTWLVAGGIALLALYLIGQEK